MEGKENITSGVTVIGAENPSSYHVAPRGEAPLGQSMVPPAGVLTAGTAGMSEGMEKKKRGRPRKYSPDGSATRVLSPTPISSAGPQSAGSYPSGKRGRGKSAASIAKQQPRFEMVSMGNWIFMLNVLMIKLVRHAFYSVVSS